MRGPVEGKPVAVVIPPAWGKTKETLLLLAATIVETFTRAGKSVVVVRFDGVRKRGESHNDYECRTPGCEQHHFTFSQGVRDISATMDFLEKCFQPAATVLVTFSAASIEGRRAAVLEGARLGGWISVVGAPDLQSAMRVVSGGVDFLGGFERGARFGLQEIQGVEVDMDRAAEDALQHRLAFLEDARRDMAALTVPLTWIHGKFDAWMDFDRVREVVSAGDSSTRRLLVVPTGHQLRTSREALDVFQLIAVEAFRLSFGQEVDGRLPDLGEVRRRSVLERRRLSSPAVSLRGFWRDYLLGRERRVGIDLMTTTSAYRQLMSLQAKELQVHEGSAVLDLGSGTGSLLETLLADNRSLPGLRLTEVDYVGDALARVRDDYAKLAGDLGARVGFVIADLDADGSLIPLVDCSQDAVLASLLISYLREPRHLLAEAVRVLVPGGRIVVSTLRPDADTSALVTKGIAELRMGHGSERVSRLSDAELESTLRDFINDAAKLLDLEEQGVFRFWDRGDLRQLLEAVGLQNVRVVRAYGSPPQVLVAVGTKRVSAPGGSALRTTAGDGNTDSTNYGEDPGTPLTS
jgi:SAM-dependent methyltransferase